MKTIIIFDNNYSKDYYLLDEERKIFDKIILNNIANEVYFDNDEKEALEAIKNNRSEKFLMARRNIQYEHIEISNVLEITDNFPTT